ncbi:LPS-assembly lipoprotein LptE [Wohlfahrtiimonas populi]|uniref:LPS-assembly lipoprotein LptE n=1 Tax=Wohlfahrtiimonas populi TaxID=1940240 RepID=UPI00098D3841|nr:hypothetical protein [Wohlfahrtiimonas populi]
MIRKFILVFSLMVIAGCGFKLRGTIPWPTDYQNVYMEGYNPSQRDSFYASVKRFFPEHVKVVNNQKDADVIIQVLSESQTARTVSGLAANRDTEEVVTLNVTVQVLDDQGNEIMPATTLTRERDFTYDESNLLGKSTDLQNVSRILRQETASMFMRRLEAAMKNIDEIKAQ